jgi:hypothetical protein
MTNRYKISQKLRQEGKVIGYPFYATSANLGQFIPAIPKAKCIHVTANTNVGKSQFMRWYFLVAPYLLYKLNPNSNFKPKFILFLLEESKEQLQDSLFSIFIFVKFKTIIEPAKLNGFSEDIITDEELKLVEAVEPYVTELLLLCNVIDNVYNPTGLYKISRRILLEAGERSYTTLKKSDVIIPESEYKKLPDENKKEFKFHSYRQNNEEEYFFIITDNVNLLEPESSNGRMMNLHDTMWKWSTEYAHKQLQKNFKAIIIDIIQQASESEKQQFTNKGGNIVDKVKPTRDGYGDNKRIARNADLILGLFAPTFYGIKTYAGYNLGEIGDYFRTVIILKNRLGRGFKEIPLFFNGAANYFAELPGDLTDQNQEIIKKGLYQKGFKKLKQ